MKDRYDYVIVGAGSAGCALASRLSAHPATTVLLIESGPVDKSLFVNMPRGIGVILGADSKYIWNYEVLPRGDQPPERWYTGRTLGGSSSVNGMVYVRGAPADYDGWAAMGCDGWSWSEVGSKFVELEDHDQGAGRWRGKGGPLHVTTRPQGNPLCEAILNAGAAMGIPRVADVNDVDVVRDGGLGYQTTTCYRGKRFSAARAFLEPARDRSNLTILTETDVLKIIFSGKCAVAVEARTKGGVLSRIEARREIIIAAGAIQTPKLLQLSGIGPAEVLAPLGIEVVVDSPNVGRNLREHRHVDLRLKVRSHSQNRELGGLRSVWSMLRYLFRSTGPMTYPIYELGGFAKSDPALDHADLQFGVLLVSSGRRNSAITLDPHPGITFMTYFTRPESQGEVRIQSADPEAPLSININHLATEIDRQRFIRSFRLNRRLAQQPALKDWVIEETFPGAEVQTDDEILARAMEVSGSCFHTAGTARMGADSGSVVDPRLRVRGVEALRVADTSIMPTLVSGNTNAPAMVIGLRAADFILADQQHLGQQRAK